MQNGQISLTVQQFAAMIDQTLLKPAVCDADFQQFCAVSAQYSFKMVAINSAMTKRCKELLHGSSVHVGAAVGFPLGQTTIAAKRFEAVEAIENGADEIDYVVNLVELKSRHPDYVEREMREIVGICRAHDVISKVIFENCYLTGEEKKQLCAIARNVGPDFIKTSTGFGPSGAMVEDVRLMKSLAGDRVKVKAAGGIRDLETALAMIEAGAERLGTSSGVALVEEYRQRQHEA